MPPRDFREWLPRTRWFRGREGDELDDWTWVKTAQEAITHLESEDVVEVSLDHDLGDPDEFGDGYMVAVWIEERVAADNTYAPPVVHVHSSNVAARETLEAAVRSIERLMATRSG